MFTRKKRFICLAFFLIFTGLMPISVVNASCPAYGGDGTSGNPYIILEACQLDSVRNNPSAFFQLGADIDLELAGYSNWDPIANFDGNFDGNLKTIKNIKFNRLTSDNVGLFGAISSSAIIQNVRIVGKPTIGQVSGKSEGRDNVGFLVGVNNGGVIKGSYAKGVLYGRYQVGGLVGRHNGGTILNSYSEVQAVGAKQVGGLAGLHGGGDISNSYATANVFGYDNYYTTDLISQNVGGLVGLHTAGVITNSYATGAVTGIHHGGQTGGLVGSLTGSGIITDSYATGQVMADNSAGVGGLVGHQDGGQITKSYATGLVTAGGFVGGLVGRSVNINGTISKSFATGWVYAFGNAGGLVGYNQGAVSDSYATGDIEGTSGSLTDTAVGGLVGYNMGGTIERSYAKGAVKDKSPLHGALAGKNTGVITDSYASGAVTYINGTTTTIITDGSVVGAGTTAGANRLTASEMKNGAHFIGFDFSSTWRIVENTDTPYLIENLPVNEANLTGLTLSTGTLSPAFTTGTASYTATVANSVYAVTLIPTTEDPLATMQVSDGSGTVTGSVYNGVYSYNVNLNVGTNPVSISVTARDGTTTKNYTFNVTRFSSNVLLSSLAVEQGTLSPQFSSSNPNYTVDVPNEVSSLNLLLTKADPNQTLTVSGAVYSSMTNNVYSYSAPNLIEGSNPIQIVVTAQDGTTTQEYTVAVTRAASSNADLSGLTLSSGTLSPAFDTGTTSYTSSVANGVSNITVTASVYDSNATLTVNGAAVTSGTPSGAINLSVGSNTVTVVATAQDGTTTQMYTVTVTRAAQESSPTSTPTPPSDKITSTEGNLTLATGKTGEVSLGDEIKIDIPANATNKELKLTIKKVVSTQILLTNNEVLASPVFEILKNFPENFSKPVTLTFSFDLISMKGNQKPVVFYYEEVKKEWVEVGGKVNGDKITVDVNHFTKYAVFFVALADTPTTDNPTDQATDVKFSDISGHWAEASIKQAVSSGIVKGYVDGTFKPNQTVSRAEFAVMLMNALKPQGAGAELAFTDTAKIGAWAKKAVTQAVQAGIINGYEDGSFRPTAKITRSEMAAMIASALKLSIESDSATGFADDKNIPSWAKGAVAALKKLDLMAGTSNNQFDPDAPATRAEAVTVLLKMSAQQSK